MRNRETHFEQVPIRVVEAILGQPRVLAAIPEKLLAPVSTPEHQASAESLKPEESVPSKEQL